MNQIYYIPSLLLLLLFCSLAQETQAQKTVAFDPQLYDTVQWRHLGPFRGGRSCAVAGVPGKPNLYYFGATGGGVWQTKDGGKHWDNISDGFFGGSVGCVSVSESNNNIIYVGGGEKTVRGNVSHGYGVWKSDDAGRSWKQKGLKDSRHISRLRIHPQNPDLIYAAVMGNLYKSHEERGVFRSKDGGDSWEKVLFVNEDVGAVDLVLDPQNPRVMYASTWRIRRSPYSLSSGGQGCGIWKSTDGGDSWKDLSKNEGLPKDTMGIIGITVSPVNPDRIWAIIESKTGGVFRSDDRGQSWTKINEDRSLRQRAWYYTRIYADTQDEDIVYVVNVRYHKSIDGGKTFKKYRAPHGDHHDLWIAPENNQRMIIADDGGAQVSYNGGGIWSTYHNQPTAQFYRVSTDNHFPYRIYAAQQDNSTVRLPHRTTGSSITDKDWESTAGCECGHIVADPVNPEIVYGGCYDGLLQRRDHSKDQSRAINVWPDNPMGHGAEDMRYRFQWNFPIFFSPHNPKKLYTCSNHLHVSYNEGQSWEVISPDLTRNEPSMQGSSGGPITQDNTSVEYYCTIFAALESPRVKDLIWVGTDDGLVHLTRDAGKTWSNVSPPDMPEWILINSMEADPFNDGGIYIAATMYKHGDFAPYLYHSTDYGKSWKKITKGIDSEHFTRVIRADPKREGLLYAGTESGMYISFDNGDNWEPFQLNLPIVPITDLALKDNNLIAATQGRSLWMIDDLTVLHQLKKEQEGKAFHLFQPKPSYRTGGAYNPKVRTAGINHPDGLMLYYYIKEKSDSTKVSLSFLEMDGDTIKTFSTQAKEKKDKLEVRQGSNLFIWNMSYPDAKKFDGMIMFWASMAGPRAMPGSYKVRLTVDGQSQEQSFEILKDPRAPSLEDLQKQFDFSIEIRDKITEAHQAIIDIRDIRTQLNNYTSRLEGDSSKQELIDLAAAIDSMMTNVEKTLYQTKNRSPQDPLNFPIRLNNKLGHLNALTQGDYPPTDQAIEVKNELTKAVNQQLSEFRRIKKEELPKFNRMVREKQVDAILLSKPKGK